MKEELISDSALVKMLKQPEQRRRGFELMVNKYSARLYWQIRHMVLDHDNSNDVLQETFIKAWLNIENFRGEARLSTWLYRIAANECLSFLQKQRNDEPIDNSESNVANQLEADPYFDGDETDKLLQTAVMQLPDKQRQVFTMKYFQGMKYEEMSEILDTSVGGLKASYHFATLKIEKFFEDLD